jgi:hypothetical protein
LLKNPPIEQHDTTLFQLIPISSPSISGIPYGSFVRIQHVLTGCWMHADGQEEQKAAFQQQQPTASTNKPVILPQVTLYPSSSLKTSRHDAHLPPLDHSHSRFSSFSTLIEHDQHQQQPITVHEKEEEEDIYRITASQELYYHDCFSITCLDQDLSDTFNIANEMLPQLHRYLSQDRFVQADDVYPIHDIEYEQIVNILVSLHIRCSF